MAHLKEQDIIDIWYKDDNTKTMSDVVEMLRQLENMNLTTKEIQDSFKNSFPDINDWSF